LITKKATTMYIAPDPLQQAQNREFSRICQERIAARARAADRTASVPRDSWRDLVDGGYLRLFHARRWGGSEADGLTQALAMESLAQACAGTFWAASISTVLCGKLLHDVAGPAAQARWLPAIVAGDSLGCFAATERGAGSDPASYHTTVRRHGRGYRLSGVKTRISNACTADVAVVLARREAADSPALCYAVVDLRRPGISRCELPTSGLRAMSWGTIEFADVELDEECVVLDASIERTLRSVEWGQLIQTMSAVGLAGAAIDLCREFVRQRCAFGRPIAHLQVVHARLADMQAELDAARLLAFEVARRKAEGQAVGEDVMMAKIYATEMAVRVSELALRNLGGSGHDSDLAVERLHRDSLANVPAGLPNDRLRELLVCPQVGVDPWRYPAFDWLTPAGLMLGDG
jgi:alkylation response protein AidB-like acyl-CoA dehydrogenase